VGRAGIAILDPAAAELRQDEAPASRDTLARLDFDSELLRYGAGL